MINREFLKCADAINTACIHHDAFEQAVLDISTRLLILTAGEVLVLLGPSRVGKSRAARQALIQTVGSFNSEKEKSVVWIDNENSQANGEFSTRAFMLYACERINHPIYGRSEFEDDSLVMRRYALVARTPERVLRDALEKGLIGLKTKYLVIDEAHHVAYVKGGNVVAARIFDSWKCLAQKAKVILILIGSYALSGIMTLAPHLIGRQGRPLEFSRYKETNAADIQAFRDVLKTYSEMLPWLDQGGSLLSWDQYLFEGSLGCVGHLSLWLREAVAWMVGHGHSSFTKEALEKTAVIGLHLAALAKEIQSGEMSMGLLTDPSKNKSDLTASHPNQSQKNKPGGDRSAGEKKGRRTPFSKKSVRRPRNGRN